jgi:hypothetical protein
MEAIAVAVTQRQAIAIERLAIHHLQTPSEIASILHLRENIDLSVHARAGGEFQRLEKKETNAASWVPSSSTENRSEPSGSFRWAWA